MADLRFLQLATDPNLIPGVYNACDQWCDYCPVTARCLAFKCQPAAGGSDIYDNVAEVMRASMTFLKDCHEAEGLAPPEELLRMLEHDPPSPPTYAPFDDPLGRMGKHYAILATAFLATHDHETQLLTEMLPSFVASPENEGTAALSD